VATGKKIKTFRFRRGLSRSFSPIPIHTVRCTVFVQKSFRHAALQSSITRQSARFLCTSERVRAARSFIIVIVYRYGSNNIIYYHRTYKILYRARYTHTTLSYIYIYIYSALCTRKHVRFGDCSPPRSRLVTAAGNTLPERVSASENVTVDGSGSGG